MAKEAIAGLILAGGSGLRLGGADKAMVALGDRPLLRHVLDRFAPQVDVIAVSANGDPARLARFGAEVLPDRTGAGLGPLAGLLEGMIWAASRGHARLATVAVDTPFLPCDMVATLDRGAGARGIALASSDSGLHPTAAIWPTDLAADLAGAIAAGERRLGRYALDRGAVRVAFASDGHDPFLNVNTPEDLDSAIRLLGRS